MKLLGFTIGENEAKIENYLFLHKELITALDIVFTGYNTGEYFFVPPDSVLEGYYQYLHDEYIQIYLDKEINAWLSHKDIQTTQLHMFRSLVSQFDFEIESWNSLKSELLKEKEFLDRYVHHDAYVSEKLKVAAYEMEKWLTEHKIHKDEVLDKRQNPFFKWNFVFVDAKRGLLIIKDHEYLINPSTQEFVFLTYLIKNVGLIVHYKEMATILRLNANTEKIKDDIDISRQVQDVKKLLKNKLDYLKVPKSESYVLLSSIQSISGSGYRLLVAPQVST